MAEKADLIEEKKATEAALKEQKRAEELKEAKIEGERKDAEGKEKKEAGKEEKKTGEKKEEKVEKKREIVSERVITVPLRDAFKKPVYSRTNYAARILRKFVSRHLKTELKKVKISGKTNSVLRGAGGRSPLKSLKVKASKDKEGIVLVEPA
jgi:large subunit ribosomal protein L31e